MIEKGEKISAKSLYEKIYGADFNDENNKTYFKKRSKYKGCAKKTDNEAINLMETTLKEFIFNNKNMQKYKDNLSKEQRKIMKKRKDDIENVYIEQDKGNRTVKLPRKGFNNYEYKVKKAIEKNSLIEINKKIIKATTEKITNLLLAHYGELSWVIIKFVAPTHYDNFKAPEIKTLIKDNKTNALEQTIRAIQPNPGSPTERLDIVIQVVAQYIERFSRK